MKHLAFCLACLLILLNASAQDHPLPAGWKVEAAPEWSAMFNRNKGWYGGDGIFVIPLDGRKHISTGATTDNLFIFSDSMIGDTEDSTAGPGHMVHNTVAFMRGRRPEPGRISFYWAKDSTGTPQTIFVPHTSGTQNGDYYWLGDGFANTPQESTYIFAYRMRNLDNKNDWSFTRMSTDLIVIPAGSKPPFADLRQVVTPLSFDGPSDEEKGTFGAGIFVNTPQATGSGSADGYVYVYGITGMAKRLVVARVKPSEFDSFDAWRFWDGSSWQTDIHHCATLTEGVSDELSLSLLPDGSYALVFTQGTMSPTVALRIGKSPVGPFGSSISLWTCTEPKENKNYFTYNAKAHPALSSPGELLISYNVNAFDFFTEIKRNPHLYRPRFIRLRLNSLN